MRRSVLIVTMFLFLAGTFSATAWAGSCVNMDKSHDAQMSQSMDMHSKDMPCKSQNKQGQTPKHCDGICLCLHISINQTPVLNDNSGVLYFKAATDYAFETAKNIVSLSTSPPSPPPKYFS